MNLTELQQWVAGGETTQSEFKATTGQRTDAAKTVCAMLNGRGGFVFFGITPKGHIKVLQVLAEIGPSSSLRVQEAMRPGAALRTVQENLQMLRDWGLVDSQGKGRAFVWMLKGVHA